MTIDEQNMAAAMLSQSFLGVISPNFRMVAISFSVEEWKICSWLEIENEEDREEIEDAVGDFSGLILDMENSALKVESVIEIWGCIPFTYVERTVYIMAYDEQAYHHRPVFPQVSGR